MAEHHLDASASLHSALLKFLLVLIEYCFVDNKLFLFISYLHPKVVND